MKHIHLSAFVLLAVITAGWVLGSETEGTAQRPVVQRLALEFSSIPDAELDSRLKLEGISDPALSRIKSLVQVVRAAQADGFQPGSRWFWAKVDEILSVGDSQSPVRQNLSSVAHADESTPSLRSQALNKLIPSSSKNASSNPTVNRTGSVMATMAAESSQPSPGTQIQNEPSGVGARTRSSAVATPPELPEKPVKLDLGASDPKRTPYAFTHGGLRMQSPFRLQRYIDPATKEPAKDSAGVETGEMQLKSDSTKVGGFIEFVYTNIWAWRPVRQELTFPTLHNPPPKFQIVTGLYDNAWDPTARVSFEFGKDEQASATAITGSGDFNAEFTLDRHVLRGYAQDGGTGYSVNLTLSASGFTDREGSKVHPRFFYGPSLALSFDDPFATKPQPRKVWFRMQGGIATIDRLFYLKDLADPSKGVSKRLVEVDGGMPKYRRTDSIGFETELFWPIRDYALLSMGARLYGKVRPAPWTLYLGLTVPIVSIADSIAPK